MTLLQDAPPALDFEPTTDAGRGLTVPLAKALGHLMVAHEAITRGWLTNNEAVIAEISEARGHLVDLVIPHELVTVDLYTQVNAYIVRLTDEDLILAPFRTTSPDDEFNPENRERLRELIRLTWALFALIDSEITGLPVADVDPGTRP